MSQLCGKCRKHLGDSKNGCPRIVLFGSALATVIGFCNLIIGGILTVGVFNAHNSLTDWELSSVSMIYSFFLENVLKYF